jgi:hypothetical protein
MACKICQGLAAELEQLERTHVETHRIVEDGSRYCVSRRDVRQLRAAERDALLDLEIVRAKLNRHKRDRHGAI